MAWISLLSLLIWSSAWTLPSDPRVDLNALSKLRQEGFEHSRVPEILSYLTDISGPRLTGSKSLARAGEWSRDRLLEWGLENARLEEWGEFGRGWELRRLSVEMIEPYHAPLVAYPRPWCRSLPDELVAAPVIVDIEEPSDLRKYRGKLKGAVILLGNSVQPPRGFEPDAERFSEEQLMSLTKDPSPRRWSEEERRRYRARRALRKKVEQFLLDEGVALRIESARGGRGAVFGRGSQDYRLDREPGIPSLVMAVEDYGRLRRILQAEVPLKLRVNLQVEISETETAASNVMAEIAGSDPWLRDEVVMLGAHLDSWHIGTGATDNAAGCTAVLEAVRLIQESGLRPRRTIRVALWTGEEQGLLGSRHWVKRELGDAREGTVTPLHDRFAAYYNLDNGTGRIRGIYLQGNSAARPVLERLIEPIRDLGVTTLTLRKTGGTDHLPFDALGLPAFQFIQDPIAYDSVTHHSNLDVFEHASVDDIQQAAVVLAWMAYSTAQMTEKLPLKPKRPRGADER